MKYLEGFNVAHFEHCVVEWYRRCGRIELAWRNFRRDGSQSYEVYVSEMMLQQTQVSRVLEHYYFPFLAEFPTLMALANATQERVLKAWEGLGYYARARNMQECARICVQKHSGNLPRDTNELQKLPGIGAYSAGAIACFGFGESVGFVDSNIARVFCRLFAIQKASTKELFSLANMLVSTHSPFEYNQALLDIGALVCVKMPKCHICPLSSMCKGKHSPQLYPHKKPRAKENLHLHLFGVYFLQGKKAYIALYQSDSALYFGLYNLPQSTNPKILKSKSKDFPLPTHIGTLKHNYTKYAISAEVSAIKCENLAKAKEVLACIDERDSHKAEFFTFAEIDTIALCSLAKKALKLLTSIA